MDENSTYYVAVSCDMQDEGLNLSCWLSTVDMWKDEERSFPFAMKCQGSDFVFWVHSNCDLTVKARQMIAEQAEKIIMRQRKINERRKVANR